MEIKNIYDAVIFFSAALTIKDALTEAIKAKTDLRGANLSGAYLSGADLRGADLYGAYLSCADLSCANLRCANLSGAYLSGADLRGADLYGAYLSCADLSCANLSGADLRGADLYGAYLSGADLRGANLSGAEDIPAIALAQIQFIPTEGAFTGWKKCRNGAIVKLGISTSAKRSHGSGRKCRCSEAKCLAIFDRNGNAIADATSEYDTSFVYRVGKMAGSCQAHWIQSPTRYRIPCPDGNRKPHSSSV